MNRTERAVSRQLAVMGTRFELGVLNRHGMMLRRSPTHKELLHALPWLRYCNAQGANIYIRPYGQFGWVLLDDLSEATLNRLAHVGFAPAVITQTSPGNYQAWIRLIVNREEKPLPCELLTAAAKVLTRHFGADPSSADWRHLGRLAGFTNRKPKHGRNGRYPFVLLHHASDSVACKGRELLVQIRRQSVQAQTKPFLDNRFVLGSYAQYAERVRQVNRHATWLADPDLSRLDFMIARFMIRQGHRPEAVIRILADSPKIATRKAGHLDDYLRRTVNAAMG